MASGLWPIVHYRSFEVVTGPKVDRSLAKTFGAVVAVMGATLLLGGLRGSKKHHTALPALGVGAGLARAAADKIYAGKGKVSPVHAADAVAELVLFGAWLARIMRRR